MVSLPDECWEGIDGCEEYGFSASGVAHLMDDADAFEWVVKEHPDIIGNEGHPLHYALNPNAYWLKQIRWHIVRKDFLRAFDELKKAWRGIYVGDEPPLARQKGFSYRNDRQWENADSYSCQASASIIRQLIHELHDAMVAQKLIEPVPDGTFTLTRENAFVKTKRYQTRVPRDGRRPNACDVDVPAAGKNIADVFLIDTKKGRLPGRWWGEDILEWIYEREGGLVLAIAGWWRQKRQVKKDATRRRKHEQALADYKQRHEQGS